MIVAVEAVTTGLVLALLMNVAVPTVAGLMVDVVVGVCAIMAADLVVGAGAVLMVAAFPKVDIVDGFLLDALSFFLGPFCFLFAVN